MAELFSDKDLWIEIRRALVILAKALKKRYDFIGLHVILGLEIKKAETKTG